LVGVIVFQLGLGEPQVVHGASQRHSLGAELEDHAVILDIL
jgi:hypothetical protein